MPQSATDILLINPANFAFNAETALSNAFQNHLNEKPEIIRQQAKQEFEAFAAVLKAKGIGVHVIEDTDRPIKPDAVFPNNWISFHADGKVIFYPMCTPNRRLERRVDIIECVGKTFEIGELVDLSHYEQKNQFLEGTGSIVFDHIHRKAYACKSVRTRPEPLTDLCEKLAYEPHIFHAADKNGKEIYHTNVMMCLAERFAVICLESITDPAEREIIAGLLHSTGHEIIEIDFGQMNRFAGNMLCLEKGNGEHLLVLSASAFSSLTARQKKALSRYAELLPLNIPTIETIGGGSVRCMIAEIFLKKK